MYVPTVNPSKDEVETIKIYAISGSVDLFCVCM